jgi:transcription initiation factor TFIID subunit 7
MLAQTLTTPAETSDRTTRSAAARSKPQPKLKLKLSEKAAAQAPGMSFLGPYDRELDSDEEELAFEEQFILRMPPGDDCERLRKMVAEREVSNDVWFKFKGEGHSELWPEMSLIGLPDY